MKKLLILLLVTLFASPLFVDARATRTKSSDVYVKGYTTKSGKYVAPYYRTPKNSTNKDNYSCIDYGRC